MAERMGYRLLHHPAVKHCRYRHAYFNDEKQRKVSDEKIRFFINTAHDIRTPLTLIKAPLEEVEEREQLSEKGKAT